MMEFPEGDDLQNTISQWSQGDFVLGDHSFLWGFHPDRPLTEVSKEQTEGADLSLGFAIAGSEVKGLAVVSQTCDIVRSFEDRHYVQVAPLVEMPDQASELAVQRRSSPRHAFLPNLAGARLVVDLDRIFTVEKSLLAIWDRQPGCSTDDQRRSLTETIRRYYTRPALPDEFVKGISELRRWFHEKHDRVVSPPRKGKEAPFHPGECLRALEMTLVRAVPSWDSPTFHVDFILVRKSDDDGIPAAAWEAFREACIGKVSLPAGITSRWSEMPFIHLSAKTFLESDVLDLDYLSDETRNAERSRCLEYGRL